MFVFDRCHHSWAAETSGKYEPDLNNLTNSFAESEFPMPEKLTNGASVTPTLVLYNTIHKCQILLP